MTNKLEYFNTMSEDHAKLRGVKPVNKVPLELRDCLLTGRMLNGDTISAYMNLIERRSELFPDFPKVWTTDTFFFTSFLRRGYAGIRRALLNVDPLTVDLILMPIHEPNCGSSGHWYLAVVDHKNSVISIYDSIKNRNHRSVLYKIKEFMDLLHTKDANKEGDMKTWNLWGERSCPSQNNGIDCGVYLCRSTFTGWRHEVPAGTAQ